MQLPDQHIHTNGNNNDKRRWKQQENTNKNDEQQQDNRTMGDVGGWWGGSVAMAQAVFFATLGNKLRKITKIFEELDPIKSRGVLCQL